MYRFPKSSFLYSFSILSLLLSNIIVFGSSVVSTLPTQNELNVSPNSNIVVVFDETMDTATITNQSLVVNGSLTGLHSGSISFDSTSITATLALANQFAQGERVTVVLTTGITNSTGTPLSSSFAWNFTTSVSGGGGTFTHDSTYSIDILPHCIFSGDFDNDGDFDLATSNFQFGRLSVLLNDGSGHFGAQAIYTVGSEVRYVFGTDFDKRWIYGLGYR